MIPGTRLEKELPVTPGVDLIAAAIVIISLKEHDGDKIPYIRTVAVDHRFSYTEAQPPYWYESKAM